MTQKYTLTLEEFWELVYKIAEIYTQKLCEQEKRIVELEKQLSCIKNFKFYE